MYCYIHVPFCRSRCIYCDFYVVLEKYGGMAGYVDALCADLTQRLAWWQSVGAPVAPLKSVYWGGGTPSLLPAADIARVHEALRDALGWAADIEVTLEANPDATASPVAQYGAAGVNRVSLGVQSLQDDELQALSRRHRAPHVSDALAQWRDVGVSNLSLDLMYGTPRQTASSWQATLEAVCALDVPHVSLYGLHVEEGTPLSRLADLPAYSRPDDEGTVSMYAQAVSTLSAAGYRRYELSNFARPGQASAHNLNYWRNGDYLALGPSAHGYAYPWRYVVRPDLAAYTEAPGLCDVTPCSPQERWENHLIFGLRLDEGVSISQWESAYGQSFEERYGTMVARHVRDGWLQWLCNDRLALTEQAIPVSNTILSEFLAPAAPESSSL